MIGYSTTAASLSDRSLYRNFFRVIPPDNIQINAMELLMIEMNWTYFAVIYDDDIYGREGVTDLDKRSQKRRICLTEKIPVDTQLSQQETISHLQDALISLLNRSSPIIGIVVFGGTKLGTSFLYAINKSLNVLQTFPILILSEASMDAGVFSVNWPTVLAGSFALNPPRRKIETFEIYWASLFQNRTKLTEASKGNTLLLNVYERWSSEKCKNSVGVTCDPLTSNFSDPVLISSPFSDYAIHAAVVLVDAIKSVHAFKCGHNLCPSFVNVRRSEIINKLAFSEVALDDFPWLKKYLKGSSVSFNGSVDAFYQQQPTSYVVYNCQAYTSINREDCFKEVGNYDRLSQKLTLLKADVKDYKFPTYTELPWNEIRKGQCSNGSVCASCISNETNPDFIIPGDLYIVAVAPVHVRGSTPMQCGDLKLGGMDIVEAIHFAIQQSKYQSGVMVPDASVGAVIIDSCIHPLIIKERLLTLYRYGLPNGEGGYSQIMNKVLGFIAEWTSDISIAVADVLTETRHVQIAYGSTAPVLSNRTLFPYFLRLTSSDILQAQAMIDIIKGMGANYIQIINTDSAYGNGGKNAILESLDTIGACVAQIITLSFFPSFNQSVVVQRIRDFSSAKVVVLFLSTSHHEWLVPSLEELTSPQEFIFIASEEWGTRPILQDVKNLIGTITLSIDLPVNQKFSEHMSNLRTTGQDVNPWLQKFMEKELNCHFEWSFNKSASKPCSVNKGLTSDYKIDFWVPFVENAVYALMTGASQTLKEQCGQTKTICDKYRANIMDLVKQIKDVQLNIRGNGNKDSIFDQNGDGLLGYNIYMVEKQVGKVKYTSIGQSVPFYWNKQKWENSMNIQGESNLKCGDKSLCPNCFTATGPETTSTPSAGFMYSTIALIVICILLLAAVIILIIKLRHKGVGQEGNYASPYITPVYTSSDRTDTSEGSSSDSPSQNTSNLYYIGQDDLYIRSHSSRLEMKEDIANHIEN
ncbi:hypothetical protein CHS0354_018813 [Potamilus streckersoni]|uniref:Receptor ligand binding region domain-containing protein n=1 Tax=Potamilus streckersoni TaxID=2493646 RepID=A0AAE0WDR6_9BIVA|nr:hypothetical protein CHS0354_018813 [Potamilus streckersoni]